MQLRLKTKITLTTAVLVLAVVGVNSTLYVMNLTKQVIRQADDRAQLVSRHIFFEAQNALVDVAKSGKSPASDSAEALRDYVQQAFDDSAPLSSSIDAEVGYSPLIYEVSITGCGWHSFGLERQIPARECQRPPEPTAFATGFQWLPSNQLSVLYGPPARVRSRLRIPDRAPGPPDPRLASFESRCKRDLLRISITPALRSAALLALVSVGVISVLLAALVSSLSLGAAQTHYRATGSHRQGRIRSATGRERR